MPNFSKKMNWDDSGNYTYSGNVNNKNYQNLIQAYGDPSTWTQEQRQAYTSARNHQAGMEALYAIAQRDEQRRFDAPENQAKLTREAGINPDLVGIQDSAAGIGGADMSEALEGANSEALQQQQQAAAVVLGAIGSVANIGGMALNGFSVFKSIELAEKQLGLVDKSLELQRLGLGLDVEDTASRVASAYTDKDIHPLVEHLAGLSDNERSSFDWSEANLRSVIGELPSFTSGFSALDSAVARYRSASAFGPSAKKRALDAIAATSRAGVGASAALGEESAVVSRGSSGYYDKLHQVELDNAKLAADLRNSELAFYMLHDDDRERMYQAVLNSPFLQNRLLQAETSLAAKQGELTDAQRQLCAQQVLSAGLAYGVQQKQVEDFNNLRSETIGEMTELRVKMNELKNRPDYKRNLRAKADYSSLESQYIAARNRLNALDIYAPVYSADAATIQNNYATWDQVNETISVAGQFIGDALGSVANLKKSSAPVTKNYINLQ